jgi:XTP/dITP diphosphohydrolase
MTRIVVATANPGKLAEFADLLRRYGLDAVSQTDFGVVVAEEPHATFVENALAKARHAARATGLAALADDSGLCVDALGGAPGVRSARFAGDPTDDRRNNAELLRRLLDCDDRRAHYTCVLVGVRCGDDAEPLIAEARWHGDIVREPRGSGGFGYDPVFRIAGRNETAAEIPREEKNRISHRALAMHALSRRLAELQA